MPSADILEIEKFAPWNGAFMVPIGLLVAPDWNVNEMAPHLFNELVEEIDKHKFDAPLQIVPIPGENLFLVIGGEHRLEAMRVLKKTHVPCCLKTSLDPEDLAALKEYSVRRNHLHGTANPDKLEALQAYLAEKMKKSESAVRRRLLLSAQRLKKKLNKSDQTPVKASGKETLEDKPSAGGAQNKPFIPPKKKTDEQVEASAQKAVTLADKHKLRSSINSLAKVMLANCENADALERGFAYFGQGGRCHLVVEMENGLAGQVKALVKRLKADKAEIGAFLEEAIRDKLETMPKKGKSKKTKAKVPNAAKGSVAAAK